MQKRTNAFIYFFFFLLLGGIFWFLGKTSLFVGIRGGLELAFSPVSQTVYGILHPDFKGKKNSELDKLKEENRSLAKKLAVYQVQEADNKALRDQFATSSLPSTTLMPGIVLGNASDHLVIAVGKKNGVQAGQAVVLKDNLLGRISKVSENLSEVELLSSTNFLISAKTSRSGAVGVIKGGGSEFLLDNVVLSDDLQVGDVVVSKGEVDLKGVGMPANLIIGKIISIDKKPSALFQTAKIKSFTESSSFSTVFVIAKVE